MASIDVYPEDLRALEDALKWVVRADRMLDDTRFDTQISLTADGLLHVIDRARRALRDEEAERMSGRGLHRIAAYSVKARW